MYQQRRPPPAWQQLKMPVKKKKIYCMVMVSPTTAPLLHHTTHGQAHTLHHNAPHTHQSDHNALMITHAIAHNTAHDDSCTTIAALSTKKLPAPPSCCSPHTLHQNMLLRARLALLMDTRTRPRKHIPVSSPSSGRSAQTPLLLCTPVGSYSYNCRRVPLSL